MTNEQLTAKARRMTAARSTEQLCTDFEASDILIDVAHAEKDATEATALAVSRGWIMDELESRDADAFATWLDTPEMTADDLRRCFGIAA